ncbi:MAG TPA: Stp1/IreP family PP2C-type Ser/Thr phosphatase [Armatimonadota bacterium]|jgi:protein phosphatase
MDLGAATHPGYVRSGNEDGYFASRELAVFAVADGMGGHEHGEVASRLALQVVDEYAPKLSQSPPTELANDLHDAVQTANTAIVSRAEAQDAHNRMGTTLVLATICGDRLYFAHIGDSRLYLLRGSSFTQLTRDHSLVQSMVDRGEITQDEAAIHPLRHQITRVVGGDSRVSPEIASQALEPGDLILLCTDGLSGAVDADQLRAILQTDATAQDKANMLIQAALTAGGPDNITAVVVSYQCPRALVPTRKTHRHVHPHLTSWQVLWLCAISVIVFLASLASWAYLNPVYVLSARTDDTLGLYQAWPLLPMLAQRPVATPDVLPVLLMDAKPYLTKYSLTNGDIHQGIRVEGVDAGIATLHDITKMMASGYLAEAKTALERHDHTLAQDRLTRAKKIGADPQLLQQLTAQLARQLTSLPAH